MDFRTLMFFRGTAQDSLALVQCELQDAFDELLSIYVPNIATFKTALTRHGAVVGGIVALCFFLCLRPSKQCVLELYTPIDGFWPVQHHILNHQDGLYIYAVPLSGYRGIHTDSHLITGHDLGNGTKVDIRRSVSHPLLPICQTINSTLAVYVSPEQFGLAWPNLTLDSRYMPRSFLRASDRTSHIMTQLGLSAKLWPWMWPDLGMAPQQCARNAFYCPAQARTVTDGGFLQATLFPHTMERITPRIEFRLCNRPCHNGCQRATPHLLSYCLDAAEY